MAEFYANVGRTCIACHRARSKAWKLRNPERAKALTQASYERNRDALLRSKYGVGIAEVDQIVARQDGTCGNKGCSTPVTNRSHIDHDHETGIVRGVLCQPCNQALGLCKEDRGRLLGLVEYLDQDMVRSAPTR